MEPTVPEVADLIARWRFDVARDALDAMVARSHVDEPDGLSARRMLAEVLRELGEPEAAYPLAETVTRVSQARYGAADPATVQARGVLGTLLHDLGRLPEAEHQYRLTVHSGATVDGPAGRALLLARANLALLRRDQGDQATAVHELADVYRTWRVRYGAEDLDSVRLASELGRLRLDLGHRTEARRLLAVAYVASNAALGEEHPQTVRIHEALREAERPLGEAPPDRLPRPHRRPRRLPRPGRKLGLTVGGVGALLVLVGALLTVAQHRPPAAVAASSGPTRSTRPTGPPADVTLRDEGTRLTVSWADPSGGRGAVLVALSRAGRPAGPLRPLPAGTRTYQITGLDPHAEYCVIVALIYPGDTVGQAAHVCTHRPG